MRRRASTAWIVLAWWIASALCAAMGSAQPLERMTDRVVFWDDRLDSVGQARHQERLVRWLVANGFRQMRSEELADWMAGHIAANDAYGTVAVMTMGYAPAPLAEEPGEGILWVRYLRAGGRIVSIGDLPFNYFEYPDARPLPQGMSERGYAALGLVGGWNQPYWGRNLEVRPTEAAAQWGFETMDGSITGFPVEAVTVAFGTYTVPETGKLGATSWLKTLRADAPLSGLLKLCQFFDGRNDAQLRDVWRAANYVGRPVTVPALPPPWAPDSPPRTTLRLSASGIPGRTALLRGEEPLATVTTVDELGAGLARLELRQGNLMLEACELPLRPVREGKRQATFSLDTAPYAFGEYELVASVLAEGKRVDEARQALSICHVPEEGFCWHVWVGTPSNPYRRDMTFRDIKAAGMEPHLTDTAVEGMDAILRQNMGFSLRLMPDLTGGKEYTYEKQPDFFRLDLERKPIPSAYAGGRPTLGISQPEVLENARKSLCDQLAPIAHHPAFRPYILTNDDYSVYYGWDFSAPVVERFRRETGLPAPTTKPEPPPGIVEDTDPWVQWYAFTLREITGGLNRALTAGVTEVRPDLRIGPIPGGMQIPYVSMWDAGQYPPLNFGPHGFNLLACYYYNTYWQPVMTNTFWMEVGRLANRDLPQWCMPDLFMTAGYVRNNLFHLLAGGVKGLAYFTYDQRNPGTWEEVRRLGATVRRLGPIQARLQPASRKDIGLLLSFTSLCFDPSHCLNLVYAYENLMQGHFDVEMTCEEEVLAGHAATYKAVLLCDVRWLRRSVYEALVRLVANGGLVLLDSSVPFDIPGAKRLAVDLAMGEELAIGHRSTPNIHTYGDDKRIAAVRQAMSEHIQPAFDPADMRLVANRFEIGGVPYLWFVNAHTGKEYMFCRERMGAGHPGSGSAEKVAQVVEWEQQQAGDIGLQVRIPNLPGVPYDLSRGCRLDVAKEGDQFVINLTMQRFGGSLVAFYPEPIASVVIAGPQNASALQDLEFRIEVRGASGAIPGAVPVEITLRDPTGNPSPLSAVRATDGGLVVFRWTPAVNDPTGRWVLTATELASGQTVTHELMVE